MRTLGTNQVDGPMWTAQVRGTRVELPRAYAIRAMSIAALCCALKCLYSTFLTALRGQFKTAICGSMQTPLMHSIVRRRTEGNLYVLVPLPRTVVTNSPNALLTLAAPGKR